MRVQRTKQHVSAARCEGERTVAHHWTSLSRNVLSIQPGAYTLSSDPAMTIDYGGTMQLGQTESGHRTCISGHTAS